MGDECKSTGGTGADDVLNVGECLAPINDRRRNAVYKSRHKHAHAIHPRAVLRHLLSLSHSLIIDRRNTTISANMGKRKHTDTGDHELMSH